MNAISICQPIPKSIVLCMGARLAKTSTEAMLVSRLGDRGFRYGAVLSSVGSLTGNVASDGPHPCYERVRHDTPDAQVCSSDRTPCGSVAKRAATIRRSKIRARFQWVAVNSARATHGVSANCNYLCAGARAWMGSSKARCQPSPSSPMIPPVRPRAHGQSKWSRCLAR